MSQSGSGKPLIMALFVAAVFAGGVGVGVLFSDRDPQPVASGAQPGRAAGPKGPVVTFDDGPNAGSQASAPGEFGDPQADRSAPAEGPSQAPDRGGPRGTEISAPPPPPPPIPPEALADAERMKRERELAGEDARDGKVTTLVYDFESDEERQAWEARYKKRWETRLKREIDIKIRQLREKIGLSNPQEVKLRKILDEELAVRTELVAKLTNKQISRGDFDQAVRDNVGGAREKLNETLTAEQLAAYNELKPREQVLRDETK